MSGFPIIDLIAGIIFVYFLLSIISSSVVEMLLTAANARAKLLGEWLYKIFDKPVQVGDHQEPLGQAIMDHCSVTALSGKGKSPSYIDAKNFTSALLEKLTFDPADPESIANDLNTFISKIQQANILSLELKRVLLTYAYEARDKYKQVSDKTASDVEIFRSKIENWYDTSMNRLTGDLKRRYSRPFTLIVATITVILMNADSINIARYLYSNPAARATVAAAAYKAADDSTQIFNQRLTSLKNNSNNDSTVQQLQTTMQTGLDDIREAKAALGEDLPFGWTTGSVKILFPKKVETINGVEEIKVNPGSSFLAILSKLTGLAATILAIMLGAPFWFDLLNKVTNLRGTGGKPASSAATTNNDVSAASPTPAPVTVLVNTNTDTEAVG